MLARGEKDLQALSLLPPLNSTDGVLWVELMRQLPPLSDRKERSCTIKLLKTKSCLASSRLWDNQQHCSLWLRPCASSLLPQLCKPPSAIGVRLSHLTFINVIYGLVFPSHPFPSTPTACSCFSIPLLLRNATELHCSNVSVAPQLLQTISMTPLPPPNETRASPQPAWRLFPT